MRNPSLFPAISALALGFAVLATQPAHAQTNADEADIIALARAQIDATVARRPVTERMRAISNDYTLFQAFSDTRIDGKSAVVALNTALEAGGGRTLHTEMLNSRVQFFGDTAILTYNTYSINQDRGGDAKADQARVTRVYARTGGRWWNVHTHISRAAKPD